LFHGTLQLSVKLRSSFQVLTQLHQETNCCRTDAAAQRQWSLIQQSCTSCILP